MIKRLANRLLRWYLHPDFYPDISGDLEELYLRNRATSAPAANWKYMLQVIVLFRPSLMRPLFKNSIIKDTGMLKNYFKIGVRSLLKQKAFTFINVMGLAVGLAAFLLIQQYVKFEKSYDRHYADADQLYRLTTDQVVDSVLGTRDAMSFAPSGKVLVEEVPEIVDATTTQNFGELIFRKGESLVTEEHVLAVDEHFLRLFTYKVLEGHSESLLTEPNTLVLSASKAKFYFGDQNPIGKTIYLQSAFDRDFKVVGIVEDPPQSTHYKFDMLMSISTIKDRLDDDAWNGYNYYTYVKLDQGADIENVRPLLPVLSKKYMGEESSLVFNLQPVIDIHLYSDFTFEPEMHGSAKAVSFLGLISVFILIIAWVNYVNLSTARSFDRAKEVGIRKVVGARRNQLMFQFITEAFMINVLGSLLALGLAELALPLFNNLISKEILDHTWNDTGFLLNVFIFAIIGTLVSGVYPALVLSGFRPVMVLKGKFRNSKQGIWLRKGLVVLQFASSLSLIACTFIVYQQVNYMRSKDIGMSIDQVVGFRNPRVNDADYEAHKQKRTLFAEELKTYPAIQGVAMISNLPGGGSSDVNSSSGGIKIVGKTDRLDATTYVLSLNDEVISVLDMEILHGRNFDRNRGMDTATVLVNEAFIKRFGLVPDVSLINEKVQFGKNPENRKHDIVGIVKDVNRSSLKNEVEPTVYFYNDTPSQVMVKLAAGKYREGLEILETTWQKFFPNDPLRYTFLDERFEGLYQEDKRFGAVFGAFAVLALVVATLGLFGLSSFMAIQRTKEVGVRKVLGASVPNIIGIFYKDFLSLIAVAFLVGAPLIYFGMTQWLDGYAYRIGFPWLFLGLSLLIVLAIALLTVGYQVYKVAVLDPSKTLRYE
ncbi:MAG: FtsX-like permease family protein [Imperialibacter sp.]|uniref:ABC transporter permease n=1 Tax=Imperialibacter sp. TaxID=2038411 RepID=UPI0032ED4243